MSKSFVRIALLLALVASPLAARDKLKAPAAPTQAKPKVTEQKKALDTKPVAEKPVAKKPAAVKPEAVKPEAVKPEAVKPEAAASPKGLSLKEAPPKVAVSRPQVQIALLLDTSSSMNGLLQQAKTQLWNVVNTFVLAERDGQSPDFLVSLYEYGRNTLSPESGFVRQVQPLTDNLDKVSSELFKLRTASRAGGDERCGQVIHAAVNELEWSPSSRDLKVIFIAGNESFSQGPIDFRNACRSAIAKSIMVNSIFCGSYAEGQRLGWAEGPRLADGAYASIDQNRATTRVEAPQDTRLKSLNTELNRTYLPFGVQGQQGVQLQLAQDKNASEEGVATLARRTVTKSSALYNNAAWDLVDAVAQKKVDLDKIDAKQLPESLRKLSLEDRKKVVAETAKKRKEVQQKIQSLLVEREKYLSKLESPAQRPSVTRGVLRKAKGGLGSLEAKRLPAPGAQAGASVDAEAPAEDQQVQQRSRKQFKGSNKAADAAPAGNSRGGYRYRGATANRETLGKAMSRLLKEQAAKKKFRLRGDETAEKKSASEKKPAEKDSSKKAEGDSSDKKKPAETKSEGETKPAETKPEGETKASEQDEASGS
ncbi:MAG: VWA domain-containing protein [Planctomycetota bacterium]